MGNKEYNKDLNIDWNKFKIKTKISSNVAQAKNAYIEFCKMLDEVGFELVSDYIGNMNKVELVCKLNNDLRLDITPNSFKRQTYRSILNFKNKLKENGDEFIKFIELTDKNSLIAEIKTFDGGITNLDISQYNSFNKSRQDFYNKLKEVNGCTIDCYKSNQTKMNIYIDGVKLNTHSNRFKTYTYKSIFSFKRKLKENNDRFIKFTGLTNKNNLIAQIETLDGGVVDLDVGTYMRFSKSRQDTFNYCASKGYRILSPYVGATEKILIDFKCGHDAHWTTPSMLKDNVGCPICRESKGERAIRMYLEDNNIEFIQEHRFEDCKHKRSLPFDFYIPKYNSCIEFDGIQHFEIKFSFNDEEFELTQIRDRIKNNYCKDNNINLLRIPYWELDSVEYILDKEFNRSREVNNKLKNV